LYPLGKQSANSAAVGKITKPQRLLIVWAIFCISYERSMMNPTCSLYKARSDFRRSLSPPIGFADFPPPGGGLLVLFLSVPQSLPLRGRWQGVSPDGRRKKKNSCSLVIKQILLCRINVCTANKATAQMCTGGCCYATPAGGAA
jgi:hypothetical protein